MMRKLLSIILASGFALGAFAQDATMSNLSDAAQQKKKDDEKQKEGWTKGGTFGLSLNQTGSTNWVAGGEPFSFSTSIAVNYAMNYKKGKNFWDNAFLLNYGFVNTTSLGYRKNEDIIDFTSKYGREMAKNTYLSALLNFRTQLDDGYDFSSGTKKLGSTAFAPAYLTIAPGVEFKNDAGNFSFFLSPLSARWVIVSSKYYEIQTNIGGGLPYGVEADKKFRFEYGGFATLKYSKELFKNVSYSTRADFFSNYKLNPQNIDIFWTNTINMAVNSWLSVKYNFNLIYDDDAIYKGSKAGTQIQSSLGVGVATKF
jgi:Protein of unknown function (DUF3078)